MMPCVQRMNVSNAVELYERPRVTTTKIRKRQRNGWYLVVRKSTSFYLLKFYVMWNPISLYRCQRLDKGPLLNHTDVRFDLDQRTRGFCYYLYQTVSFQDFIFMMKTILVGYNPYFLYVHNTLLFSSEKTTKSLYII